MHVGLEINVSSQYQRDGLISVGNQCGTRIDMLLKPETQVVVMGLCT